MGSKKRLFYLDNIRIVLTILVILHHAALAYGGEGLHPYKDPAPDFISPILFSFFVGINQAYFMSAFFFLSGYFTPGSLARKGVVSFLSDRFIRLGIPILIYILILLPINDWLLDVWLNGSSEYAVNVRWEVGHLWFLQALLLFSIGYVVFKQIYKSIVSLLPDQFPGKAKLWGVITVLALLTFAVRIFYPVGESFWGMQLGHFVHYIAAFSVGMLAYRGNWLQHLTEAIGRYWGYISAFIIPLLGLIGIAAGALTNPNAAKLLLGGVNPFAFVYAGWESIVMVAMVIWLLYHFEKKYNVTNDTLKWLSANAYAVYIIHQTVLVAVNVALHNLALTSSLKFFVASLITIPLCFSLSALIRMPKFVQRVTG